MIEIIAFLLQQPALQAQPQSPPAPQQQVKPEAPIVASQRPTVVNGTTLPANTEITLRLDQELSSKRMKEGQQFNLSVASDVVIGNYVVIPRGTLAKGVIAYRTGKGAFGKSAKMEIDLTEIILGDRHIPITGHYRQEGEGNTGATVGTAVAAGVFAAFVTGRSAVFPQGREFKAFTREAIPVALAQ